tara:strand:+ start:666 stop:893 length:228 start_codon:yes stop_codon:yes gene_type:complete
MPGSKPKIDLKFWNDIFEKLNKLCLRIKSVKGNYDIDDPEIRWCEDRIEYFNGEERVLSKEEMETANSMWRKYAV